MLKLHYLKIIKYNLTEKIKYGTNNNKKITRMCVSVFDPLICPTPTTFYDTFVGLQRQVITYMSPRDSDSLA